VSTRSIIQKKLADRHANILRKDINTSIEIILKSIISEVKNGSKFELRNFGSIFLKKLKYKIARNPRTGDTITLPEGRKTIRFRASKNLLKRLNQN
jgi:integration host factor subunit beta